MLPLTLNILINTLLNLPLTTDYFLSDNDGIKSNNLPKGTWFRNIWKACSLKQDISGNRYHKVDKFTSLGPGQKLTPLSL